MTSKSSFFSAQRFITITLCFLGAVLAPVSSRGATRPNIIFILVDDLGWGDVGVFHQNSRRDAHDPSLPYHTTPNLDRMAADGVRFTHHYVAAPVCASSRASLLQGVTQGHVGVRDNQFDKALDDNHTLGTVLHQAGYATAAIGKWGLAGLGLTPSDWTAHPLNRGFDYFYGYIHHVDGHEHYPKEAPYFGKKAEKNGPIIVWENHTDATAPLDKCYTADLWTARAKKWIVEQEQTDPRKPFFLYLAYDTPHAVLELPTQAYPAGGGLHGGMQWLGKPGHAITTASGTIDSWTHPDYVNAIYDDDHNPATPAKPWPDVYRRYATDVRRIDDAVGDLFQLLKDLKIDDNTLVVFASDNGPSIESYLKEPITPEFFSSYGPFDGIKRDCWEGGMRTPAIARWPAAIPSGRVVEHPSAMWDWLPTFANAAGLPAPARADGISLVPQMTGKGVEASRDGLYFEYFQNGRTPDFASFEPGHRNRRREQMQAVRIGDLMGVRYDVKSAADDFEIYNVVSDPKEAINLAKVKNADQTVIASLNQKFTIRTLQTHMKDFALRSRRPDPEAPRPYDLTPMPAVTDRETEPGIAWTYYEGAFPWVPDFTGLSARKSGIDSAISADHLDRSTDAGLCFTGCLRVPREGEYTFTLRTDTGAELRLHEATVIDADFKYQPGTVKTGTVRLQAGLHPFRLSYRRGTGASPQLELQWQGPGIPKQSIPGSVLCHPKG